VDTMSGSHGKWALPTPSRMPATGSTDTGSIMHLPIFWSSENAFLMDSMASLFPGWGCTAVGIGHERSHLVGRFRGERPLGQLTAGIASERADLRLDRRNRRQADAQLVDADAEQDRYRARVAGDAAADADAPLLGMGALDGMRDQPEDRRAQAV